MVCTSGWCGRRIASAVPPQRNNSERDKPKLAPVKEYIDRILESDKEEVRQIILRPETIIEPLKKLEAQERESKKQDAHEVLSLDRELQRLEQEEQRLLEAYRTGVITQAQLGSQLESLNAKRESADVRKVELTAVPASLSDAAEASVHDYCDEASRNMQSFGFDEWQQLLRAIIDEIVFESPTLRIQGRIAFDEEVAKSEEASGSLTDQSSKAANWTRSCELGGASGDYGASVP